MESPVTHPIDPDDAAEVYLAFSLLRRLHGTPWAELDLPVVEKDGTPMTHGAALEERMEGLSLPDSLVTPAEKTLAAARFLDAHGQGPVPRLRRADAAAFQRIGDAVALSASAEVMAGDPMDDFGAFVALGPAWTPQETLELLPVYLDDDSSALDDARALAAVTVALWEALLDTLTAQGPTSLDNEKVQGLRGRLDGFTAAWEEARGTAEA